MINSILLENTAFELYQSKAYQGTKEALDLAIERIVLKMLKIKGDTPTKQQLDDIKQTINKYISDGYKNIIEDIKTESVEVATITYDYMMLDIATRGIPQTVINDLLKSDREIQPKYTLQKLFDISEDNHIRQLKVELSSALAQGLSLPNIVKSMQEKHTNLTKGQLRTNIYTTLTESRESARYAAYKTFEDRGLIEGYRSRGVLDFNTSEQCRTLDGKEYFVKLEEIPNKPPRHFNCRSKLAPIVKDSIRSGIRASKFGETKARTYEEWFNSIDEATKQKFMSPIKYKAYKNGLFNIKSLADLDGKLDINGVKDVLKGAKQVPTIDFGYGGKFNKYVEDIRPEAKIIIDKLPKPDKILLTKTRGSYNSDSRTITTIDNKKTFVHEYGHHINDFAKPELIRAGGRIKIKQTLSETELFKNAYESDKVKYSSIDIDKVVKLIDDSGYDSKTKQAFGISDIMDSFRNGHIRQFKERAGHGIAGYESDKTKRDETFANMFEIWASGKEWERAKELFPNLTKYLEDIINEL